MQVSAIYSSHELRVTQKLNKLPPKRGHPIFGLENVAIIVIMTMMTFTCRSPFYLFYDEN
jgi:hypothetical protein